MAEIKKIRLMNKISHSNKWENEDIITVKKDLDENDLDKLVKKIKG